VSVDCGGAQKSQLSRGPGVRTQRPFSYHWIKKNVSRPVSGSMTSVFISVLTLYGRKDIRPMYSGTTYPQRSLQDYLHKEERSSPGSPGTWPP